MITPNIANQTNGAFQLAYEMAILVPSHGPPNPPTPYERITQPMKSDLLR